MNLFIFYLSLFLIFSLAPPSLASKESNTDEQQLYIGIEINNSPYISLDSNAQATGLLIKYVRQLCKTISVKCKFVTGNFASMLKAIHLYKLDILLISEQLVLPKTDKLKLTAPLCKIQPVFIHSSDLSNSIEKQDLTETTIGVQEGSRLHFQLIETYAPQVTIKPYSLLESGLFDLLTHRIERLATDKAFASAHLEKTTFATHYITTPFSIKNGGGESKGNISNKELDFLSRYNFFSTQMTLAVRKDDQHIYEKLTLAIQNKGQTPYCSNLLPIKD
jgi:ABC-type amino acid transport substrate-binding protein